MHAKHYDMFSGLMSSVAMCREQTRMQVRGSDPPIRAGQAEDASRFLRRYRRETPWQKYASPPPEPSPPWQKYAEALLYGGETLSQRTHHDLFSGASPPHRDHALLSRHREDGVVAARSPGGGVNEEMDGLVRYRGWWDLGEHNVQVNGPEDLLQGVESEPTQFTLDEIGAVLHDGLELDVPVAALPPGDKVQHVGAPSRLPLLPTGVAGESHGKGGEEGEVRGLVPHPEKSREEVDLTGHSGYGQEACRPHD
jgi:hypothetical protein